MLSQSRTAHSESVGGATSVAELCYVGAWRAAVKTGHRAGKGGAGEKKEWEQLTKDTRTEGTIPSHVKHVSGRMSDASQTSRSCSELKSVSGHRRTHTRVERRYLWVEIEVEQRVFGKERLPGVSSQRQSCLHLMRGRSRGAGKPAKVHDEAVVEHTQVLADARSLQD